VRAGMANENLLIQRFIGAGERFFSNQRAHCAWGGHFVAGVPVLLQLPAVGLPLVGKDDDPDQREDLCCRICLDKLKRRANAL
jgi:hypothetical protein